MKSNKHKNEIYNPFNLEGEFFLQKNSDGNPHTITCRVKDIPEFQLPIRKDGYIPKSGLILCEHIAKKAKNKKILEIGCGECGIVSVTAARAGATRVTATDIDENAIDWLSRINTDQKLQMDVNQADLFPDEASQFDIIVSNPPQMPTEEVNNHDSGGYYGRGIVDRIIDGAGQYLNLSGELILLLFSFLGVETKTNHQPSIFETLNTKGFNSTILSRHLYPIRKGGKTEKAIDHIKGVYPCYDFQYDNQGNILNELVVLSATRNHNI